MGAGGALSKMSFWDFVRMRLFGTGSGTAPTVPTTPPTPPAQPAPAPELEAVTLNNEFKALVTAFEELGVTGTAAAQFAELKGIAVYWLTLILEIEEKFVEHGFISIPDSVRKNRLVINLRKVLELMRSILDEEKAKRGR